LVFLLFSSSSSLFVLWSYYAPKKTKTPPLSFHRTVNPEKFPSQTIPQPPPPGKSCVTSSSLTPVLFFCFLVLGIAFKNPNPTSSKGLFQFKNPHLLCSFFIRAYPPSLVCWPPPTPPVPKHGACSYCPFRESKYKAPPKHPSNIRIAVIFFMNPPPPKNGSPCSNHLVGPTAFFPFSEIGDR